MKKVSYLVVGAGGRGNGYAQYALTHPDLAQVVAVAEPDAYRREKCATLHGIPEASRFATWEEAVAQPRLADAVIISTLDDLHEAPAVAFAEKGYDILLEKPMAPTEAACERIVAAAKRAGVLFGVCHVLRYTAFTRAMKKVLDQGLIGEVVSIQHIEPVLFWHQAHSFVRGKWRREDTSTFMLLAKSCHDLDWMRYMMGKPYTRVSSFGRLSHFRKQQAPAGATDRCWSCPVEQTCPYSAKRIYYQAYREGHRDWPVDVLCDELTEENLIKALQEGPYGRCVYACDNDVVDHQVVNMEFEGGASGSFTMTAFGEGHRTTRIFGTHGELTGDSSSVRHFDFLTRTWHEHEVPAHDPSILGGHGGGDYYLMEAFTRAVAERDPSFILSGADESLETHRAVFAAERARLKGTVERI